MFLKDISVFSSLARNMEWLSARQKVLSQNIANADTPGYEARDLKELSFRELLHKPHQGMKMAKTSTGHMTPPGASDGRFAESRIEAPDSTPNKNTVVLEDEILKVNDARMAFDLAASLYRKHTQMLKTAIGGRGG
ncbi:flagellar basal body rod protein FlgB [Minwuia sp.]|uniref:flagellar basal body rod protein FlgB n=1 Tax=Minwuia sp. TaxID=2493630 RepID=UPI003A942D45